MSELDEIFDNEVEKTVDLKNQLAAKCAELLVENYNLETRIKEMSGALNKILTNAQKEFDDHTAENGSYDPTTGVTEFGLTEEHNYYLAEQVEALELIINPILNSKGEA